MTNLHNILLLLSITATIVHCNIPCYLDPVSGDANSVKQGLSRICINKNIEHPTNYQWGIEKTLNKRAYGQGSFGQIYLLPNNKVYKKMKVEDPENFIKVYQEVATSGCLQEQLSTFAVAQECYYNAQRSQGGSGMILTVWLLMELYPRTLEKVMKEKFQSLDFGNESSTKYTRPIINESPQLLKWKIDLMLQLANQVNFLHTQTYTPSDMLQNVSVQSIHGMIHRDIKTENVLMDQNNKPHLADFGFAKFGKSFSDQLGTPEYGAPEMFSNSRGPYTNSVDIYSLSTIFYEIVNSTFDKYTSVKSHFDMREGHQKPFTAKDFPGFEWMVGMADMTASQRMSMSDVIIRLQQMSGHAKQRQEVVEVDAYNPSENQIGIKYNNQIKMQEMVRKPIVANDFVNEQFQNLKVQPKYKVHNMFDANQIMLDHNPKLNVQQQDFMGYNVNIKQQFMESPYENINNLHAFKMKQKQDQFQEMTNPFMNANKQKMKQNYRNQNEMAFNEEIFDNLRPSVLDQYKQGMGQKNRDKNRLEEIPMKNSVSFRNPYQGNQVDTRKNHQNRLNSSDQKYVKANEPVISLKEQFRRKNYGSNLQLFRRERRRLI